MVEITTKPLRATRTGTERMLAYDPAGGATPTDKLAVLARDVLLGVVNDLLTGGNTDPLSASMGALLNTRQQALDSALQVLIARVDALGAGGGPGPDPATPTAVVLPATATFNVPSNYEDGVIAGWVIPTTAGNPAPDYEIVPPIPGITIGPYGDFILEDASTYFAAVAAEPLVTTLTASNGVGSASNCVVTMSFLDGDYGDLMEHAANMVMLLNLQDNDTVTIDAGAVIEEVVDLIDTERKFRNDYYPQWRPTRTKSSIVSAGMPAARFLSSSVQNAYGLFNVERIRRWGMLRVRYNSSAGTQLSVAADGMYPGPAGSSFPYISTPTLFGRPIVLTLWWTVAGVFHLRINGVEVGTKDIATLPAADNWNGPTYPGAAIITAYSISAPSAASCFFADGVALGNQKSWKPSPFHGDIMHVANYCNVNATFPHPQESL